jgi:hypothetical protein
MTALSDPLPTTRDIMDAIRLLRLEVKAIDARLDAFESRLDALTYAVDMLHQGYVTRGKQIDGLLRDSSVPRDEEAL